MDWQQNWNNGVNGTVVIPAIKYGSITPSRNGFWVKLSKFGDGVTGYLDRNGKCIIPAVNYTEVYPLDNGVFEIIANGKASIVDSLGNILISTKYSGIHPVKDNDGSWYYETYLGNGKGKCHYKVTLLLNHNQQHRERK